MALNPDSIDGIAGIVMPKGVGRTNGNVASTQGAQEKTQFWANTQVKLPFQGPDMTEPEDRWFTVFGTPLDRLEERTVTGEATTAKAFAYHTEVAVQNVFIKKAKAMLETLAPGDSEVLKDFGDVRIVVSRINAPQQAKTPNAVGVSLDGLLASLA